MAQKRSTPKTRKAPSKAAPPLKRTPAKKPQAKGPAHFGASATRARSGAIDIIGAPLTVAAIALAVLILVPTDAPVAYWANYGLTFVFGVGAILLPVALLVYALSLFLHGSTAVSGRFALGLIIIVSALLGLISLLSAPLGMSGPSLTYLALGNFAAGHGGAWGGVLAWALLATVGAAIALVVFIGLVVIGAVICGFSISGLFAKVREKHELRQEEREAARSSAGLEEHGGLFAGMRRNRAQSTPSLKGEYGAPGQMTSRNRAGKTKRIDEPKTTFIGERKTSVLKRTPLTPEEMAQFGMVDGDGQSADVLGEPGAYGAGAEKTFHPELTSFVEPTGAISYEGDDSTDGEGATDAHSTTQTDSQVAATDATADTGKSEVQDGAQKGTDSPAKNASSQAKPTKKDAPKTAQEQEIALPPMSLLQSNPQSGISAASEKDLQKTAERLQATLEEFGLRARVKGWVSGPLVTTFKIEMGEGERVNKITNLEDDIALALAAASVRIYAPIPGTSLVGIEIPNAKRTNVCLGDVLSYAQGGPLELAVGRDSEGHPHLIDLAKLPHLLVAGTTGSGKSVMLNAAIMSILMRATSDQVRFIMVDPKRVEFTCYTGLPHLYVPVVNEPKQAASALQWAVSEMERRLRIFEKAASRDITAYNTLVKKGKLGEDVEPMPYFVIVIDELADLMMVAGKEVESSIVRIAQLGRAAGIHLIVATQRPSADVVTGLIKANIDNRVALSVDNGTNSRIIIDQNGAEKLLGNGDMLIKLRGQNTPQRIQGCYVSDPEIEKTVRFISEQKEADYHDEILTAVFPTGPGGSASGGAGAAEDDDPLVWDAAEIVVKSRLGSTSGLQRSLRVGYARAGRIMDMLEAKGIVGPPDGAKPREVLVTQEELEELRASQASHEEEVY